MGVKTENKSLQLRVDNVTFFVDFTAMRCGYNSPLVGGSLGLTSEVLDALPNLEQAQREIEILLSSARPAQSELRSALELHRSLVRLILVLQKC